MQNQCSLSNYCYINRRLFTEDLMLQALLAHFKQAKRQVTAKKYMPWDFQTTCAAQIKHPLHQFVHFRHFFVPTVKGSVPSP